MSSRAMSIGGYVTIFLILSLLTVLTVSISFIPLTPGWHLGAGIGVGAVKAVLVVLFFMHAAFSPRVNWLAIMAAVLWLIILLSLSIADYATRLQAPYMPGH